MKSLCNQLDSSVILDCSSIAARFNIDFTTVNRDESSLNEHPPIAGFLRLESNREAFFTSFLAWRR